MQLGLLWWHWGMKFLFAPEVFIVQNVSCPQTKQVSGPKKHSITKIHIWLLLYQFLWGQKSAGAGTRHDGDFSSLTGNLTF